MIEIQLHVTDGASQALRNVIQSLTGPEMAALHEVAGRAAVNAAVAWHREFDRAGGWRGPRYPGRASGVGSSFGADVAQGWHFREADTGGAVIANDADFYAFKVRGGTIRPKRARFLTIPLIREAAGLHAAVYQQNTGKRLFRPKGKFVLMEKTAGGKARSVYALLRSVTMGPWPNAVPDESLLAGAFMKRFRESLAETIAVS